MKLERSTPVAANVPPRAIINLLNAVKEENHELHSLMLVKGGKVIFERFWEPYGPDYRHQLFSLSKSFTSTAVGFAVQEGLLTVNTKISDIFTEEFEKLGVMLDDEVRDITVKNLLTMSTGMEYEGWNRQDHSNHILSFLASHIKDKPGQTFRYSSVSTFMCSAAVTRLTGMSVAEYLTPRLFEPLGIENFFWAKADTSTASGASAINMGGFGLFITVEDIAKFGQFILQKGVWNGKRLLNAEWIEEATSKHIENGQKYDDDWGCGYGYQFWRCIPDGVFRGDGAHGQYCVFVPESDMVIAANSNLDMGRFMKLLWKMLDEMKTLAVNESDAAELDAMKDFSHLTKYAAGHEYPAFRAMYKADDSGLNIYFDFNKRDGVVAINTSSRNIPACTLFFTHGNWTKGAAAYYPHFDLTNLSDDKAYRVTAFGSWEGRVFHAVTWYYETASRDELRCTFNKDFSQVTVEYRGGAYNEPFKEMFKAKRTADR